MPQESVTFDYGNLIREPSTGFKLYVLFLLVVRVMMRIKLIRIWLAVPPFRGSPKANSPQYVHLLRSSSTSLKQWIGCVFLSYGILFSTRLYNVSKDVLNDNRAGGAALFVIEDYAVGLSMALLVVSFAFLARWHLLRRIERLGATPNLDNC